MRKVRNATVVLLVTAIATGAFAEQLKKITFGPLHRRIMETARGLVGKKQIVIDGKRYRYDCSGYVTAVFVANGIDPFRPALTYSGRNGCEILYKIAKDHYQVHRRRYPLKGDIIFFQNTVDYNKNRKRDDGLTHVGIVDYVDRDGTIHYLHLVSKGIVRYAMNLKHPKTWKDKDGKILNDWLMRRPSWDKDRTRYGSAQFFFAFATLPELQAAAK